MTDAVARAAGEERRLLGHSTISTGPRLRPVIGAIVRADTVETLRPAAEIVELLPHDGHLLVERVDPDLILIESGAFEAAGPWSSSGDPSTADRSRRLLRVVELAHDQKRPTVLWWSGRTERTPALMAFESRVDLVVRADPGETDGSAVGWSTGVQLDRFNPVGVVGERVGGPVYAGGWDPGARLSARRFGEAVLRAARASGLEIWCDSDDASDGTAFPGDLRDLVRRRIEPGFAADAYRSNDVFLAEPLSDPDGVRRIGDRTLAQLATGARLVGPELSEVDPVLADSVVPIRAADQTSRALDDALGRGRSTGAERRTILRRLFEEYATELALGDLLGSLGLDGFRSYERDVCAVARIASRTEVARFVDDVARQRHRPVEAVLVGHDQALVATALAELDRLGIDGVAIDGQADRGSLRAAARRARAGRLWWWSAGMAVDADYLLDLVIAGRTSRAVVVGPVDGSEDAFVADLAAAGSLTAREAAVHLPDPVGPSLADWAQAGLTLYGVGRAGGSSPS